MVALMTPVPTPSIIGKTRTGHFSEAPRRVGGTHMPPSRRLRAEVFVRALLPLSRQSSRFAGCRHI